MRWRHYRRVESTPEINRSIKYCKFRSVAIHVHFGFHRLYFSFYPGISQLALSEWLLQLPATPTIFLLTSNYEPKSLIAEPCSTDRFPMRTGSRWRDMLRHVYTTSLCAVTTRSAPMFLFRSSGVKVFDFVTQEPPLNLLFPGKLCRTHDCCNTTIPKSLRVTDTNQANCLQMFSASSRRRAYRHFEWYLLWVIGCIHWLFLACWCRALFNLSSNSKYINTRLPNYLLHYPIWKQLRTILCVELGLWRGGLRSFMFRQARNEIGTR